MIQAPMRYNALYFEALKTALEKAFKISKGMQ